jgi:hypothetical protein
VRKIYHAFATLNSEERMNLWFIIDEQAHFYSTDDKNLDEIESLNVVPFSSTPTMNLASQRTESSIANGTQLKEVNDVPFRPNRYTCWKRDQSVISYLPFVLKQLLFALAQIGYTEPFIGS